MWPEYQPRYNGVFPYQSYFIYWLTCYCYATDKEQIILVKI